MSAGPDASAAPLPALLRAYRYGLWALEPIAAGLLAWRTGRGKEDRGRLPERRGRAGRPRPPGPLAWMHGASVGEVLSLLPLVERLAGQGFAVLVTSGTVSSAEVVARRLPPGALHQFAPLDAPRYVRRFLAHWRPAFALVAESELWPNTVLELQRAGVPLVLVNARLSERSFGRWSRWPAGARALLSRVALCLAQSPVDAERYARLGTPRVQVSGNLKFDSPPPPADPGELARLSGTIADRPVWVAASTHPGEEEAIVHAHRALRAGAPNLLTILAPRHPHRGADVAARAVAGGLRVGRRSQGARPEAGVEFYVADTLGELGLFYRLAPVVFVGGSLVPRGGQNPIEPVRLGAAILHGPHVANFAAVYGAVDAAGAALRVSSGDELARALALLLGDTARTRGMARDGAAALAAFGGAVERTMGALEPFLEGARRSLAP